MKRLFTLLLALALMLTATTALADPVKIGMVTPEGDHGFTGESIAHARAEIAAQEAANADIEFKYEVGGEAAKQIAAIETILSWGPDVIVLWPTEGEQLRNAAQMIVDEGVKLIIYDRLIDGFTGMSGEIMGDNVAIGNMMGEMLLSRYADRLEAGEELQYLLFIGDSSTVSVQRTQGMLDVIEASPYKDQFVQIQESFQTDWSNTRSQELMENWLNTSDAETVAGLDFILTHDDEIVDGIMLALGGYDGELGADLITGIGGRRETLATFDSEQKVDLVTYFFSPSYIREAVRLGVACALGEQYDGQDIEGQMFLLKSFQIDKDTVEDYRSGEIFAERYSLD